MRLEEYFVSFLFDFCTIKLDKWQFPANTDDWLLIFGLQMWIAKAEYDESGPSIVHRKCF